MTYNEPNIDMIQNSLKKAQEINVDALREYAEQVSKIDKKTPLKTIFDVSGIHGQNPEPKIVKHQLPVVQDEFSQITDYNITNVLNNPVFESQPPVTETITLNPTITEFNPSTNQSVTKPTVTEQIQTIMDTLSIHPEDMELAYYLQQALQISKGQMIDPTTNQPMYWKYVGRSQSLGPNAHKIDVNGNYNFILYCYDKRVLMTTDNKLVHLTNPKQYSKTVWKYVHKYIDTFRYFWVYNKNIRPMTPNERKQCIIDFYNSNPFRNGWS